MIAKIIGFGRLSKKGVIHAIGGNGRALCNKKLIDIDSELNAMLCDCGNCKRLQPYLDLVEEISEKKKKPENTTSVIINNGELIEDCQVDFDSFDPIKPMGFKNIFAERINNIEDQFLAASLENGKYNIIHRLSNQVFFGSVPALYLSPCLIMLNSVKEQWTGRSTPEKSWLEDIKRAFSIGYCFADEYSMNLIEEETEEITKLNQEITKFKIDNGELGEEIDKLANKIKNFENYKLEIEKLKNHVIDLSLENAELKQQKIANNIINSNLAKSKQNSEKNKKVLTTKIKHVKLPTQSETKTTKQKIRRFNFRS